MIFVLERVSDPAIEPVTLAEARQHLRAYTDQTDEDDLIEDLIVEAREWVEDYTGRALIDQTWRLTLTDSTDVTGYTDSNTVTPIYTGQFTQNAYGVLLRKSPVIALVGLSSFDSSGAETVLDVDDYQIWEADSKWPRVKAITGSTFGGDTLKVVYRAGFADRTGSPTEDASVVPERFKRSIKLYVEALYDRDEKMMPMLLDVAKRLIEPERAELSLA